MLKKRYIYKYINTISYHNKTFYVKMKIEFKNCNNCNLIIKEEKSFISKIIKWCLKWI